MNHYSIIVAIECITHSINSSWEEENEFRNSILLKIEKDHDFLIEDIYSSSDDITDAFGILLDDLDAGVYRIKFGLECQDEECEAIDVEIKPVSWPNLEEIEN